MKLLWVLSALLLSGCGSDDSRSPPRFVYIYQGAVNDGLTYADIVEDTQTGVRYLLISRNGNPAVCVLQSGPTK